MSGLTSSAGIHQPTRDVSEITRDEVAFICSWTRSEAEKVRSVGVSADAGGGDAARPATPPAAAAAAAADDAAHSVDDAALPPLLFEVFADLARGMPGVAAHSIDVATAAQLVQGLRVVEENDVQRRDAEVDPAHFALMDTPALGRSAAALTLDDGGGTLVWTQLTHFLRRADIATFVFVPVWFLLCFPVNVVMWAAHGVDGGAPDSEVAPTMRAIMNRLFPIFAETKKWTDGAKLVIIVADAFPYVNHPYALEEAWTDFSVLPGCMVESVHELCAVFALHFASMTAITMSALAYDRLEP